MHSLRSDTASDAWAKLLKSMVHSESTVSPRGMLVKEVMGYQSVVDMRSPIIDNGARDLGYKFQAAEAAWILSGDNRVETIAPYSKVISNFSDDGVRFFGAYGPKIIDQLTHVVESIGADPDTRQAVINIWRENPRSSKDIPCTISVQFLVRDGMVHVVDTMRSSDAWLGWPYDVFNFAMLGAWVALELRSRYGMHLAMGDLYLTAGSQHLYERNWEGAEKCLDSWADEKSRTDEAGRIPVPHLDPLSWFNSSSEMIEWLWGAAEEGGSIDAFYRKEDIF